MPPPIPTLAQAQLQFHSPLGWPLWVTLAGIPVGIIALYFLKLRRRPVQVPSTLLWRRSIEDLHVNSLFQRLRRNLLLFLQLLVVFLAMLALAGPRFKGWESQGRRYILTIDNSASMSARDTEPSRLERAKREALKIVDDMEADDLAMVVSFADRAAVVSSYTGNRDLLRQRIRGIRPTEEATSLGEALHVAAGLANPSKQIGEGVVATSVVPPKLMLYTDGGFDDVEGFSLGNLEPEVVVIGPPPPPLEIPAEETPEAPAGATANPKKAVPPSDNLAILALQAARNDEDPDQIQVFGRVHNYRAEPAQARARLLRFDPAKPGDEGTLIDAIALDVEPQADQAFQFDMPDAGAMELEVQLESADSLPLDDRAYLAFGNPRKAEVLVVTPGNRYLEDTLSTAATETLANVTTVTPEESTSEAVAQRVAAGRFDLVVYDRVRPEGPPEANALYFGVLPPGKGFENGKEIEGPIILDWDVAHPLTRYIRDLNLVIIRKAVTVEPPAGSDVLIESNQGPLAFVTPRSGYVDAVVTFALLDGREFNTNWHLKSSFPLFLFNSLRVLGNARESGGDEVHRPGEPVVLRAGSATERIKVTDPSGRSVNLDRSPQGTFIYNGAKQAGIYRARWGDDGAQSFAVNLFDPRESNLATRGLPPPNLRELARSGEDYNRLAESYEIKIGATPVEGTRRTAPATKDWWRYLAMLALGVLLLEWYIYNRRVYV